MSRRPIQSSIRTEVDAADGAAEQLRQLFREALSSWASGVAVLAVSDGATIEAITVTSFSALSMEPCLVLVCLGNSAAPLPVLRATGRFTISILAQDQRRAASVIADRMPGRQSLFRAADDPVLNGALVALRCRLRDEYDGGDHRIVTGTVEAVDLGDRGEPLLYHARGYRALE
jgi:flavin reductase (DIM6/NTAB) family NADH-FMN oxidoreductase RutF